MRTRNKIVLGGVLAGIVATTLIIALFPVILYGTSVQTVTINYSPSVNAYSSASPSDDSGLAYTFSGSASIDADFSVINPYAYFDLKLKGNCHGSGSIDLSNIPGFESLEVYLLFQLTITNPLGQTLNVNYNLVNLVGIVDANLVVGNDIMQIVNGTYSVDLDTELTIRYNGAEVFTGALSLSGNVDITVY